MLAGTAVSIWQSVRAARAERAALAFAQAERQARRAESAQRQLAEDRLRFLVMALGVATPEIDPANVTDAVLQQSWESILSGLEMAPGARAALLLSVGRSYANMGRDEAAVRELRRCLEIAEDPSVIHNAKYYLATSCLFLGKTDEGTAILRDLLRQKLDRISGSDVDELRAAWPGLDSAQARPTDRPGQRGLELDGVDDYVVLPNLQFDGRPPWTLEAIVNAAAIDQYKSRAATNWTSLISTTDGGGIGLDTHAGKWSIELYAPEKYHSQWASDYVRASARLAPALGRWQHLAGVWDGKVLRFYVDGKLQETRQGVEVCSSLSEGPFMLGADPADLDFDEVAEGLFHGVIRAARISRAAEYAKSFPKPHRLEKTPQAVGLYDFTIDTGRYAIDRSGHNHHGIIVGARFVPANE
jgi:hypothetical protein